MFTLAFWKAAAERSLKTAAQTAIATIGTTAAFNAVNWSVIGMVVLLATALSVLTSIASAATTDGSPSLSGAETLTPLPRHAVDPVTDDGTPPTTTLS